MPIKAAAGRLGVSPDTIRRRLKSGELAGQKEQTPQGFTWLVEVPYTIEPPPRPDASPEPPPAPPADSAPDQSTAPAAEVRRLEQLVEVLQTELEARRREVEQLHIVLSQQARALALPAPQEAPTPATDPPRQPPTQDRPSWWQRLRSRLGSA
ncbi:MAG: hypothetical protein M3R02_03830 [Chloroflexota bacterium]|nr:hypothetical protein [Chloroflexota bacterium]